MGCITTASLWAHYPRTSKIPSSGGSTTLAADGKLHSSRNTNGGTGQETPDSQSRAIDSGILFEFEGKSWIVDDEHTNLPFHRVYLGSTSISNTPRQQPSKLQRIEGDYTLNARMSLLFDKAEHISTVVRGLWIST